MLRKSFALSLVGALSLTLSGAASVQAQTPRVSASQKGSLLIYSKIEVKWDAAGNVIQDTFLDISNDFPGDVHIQGYFINGDTELPEICSGDPCTQIIQEYEPGWNTADCGFDLSGDQPSFWSAAQGFIGDGRRGGFGCTSFDVLDGNGRPDLESNVPGDRMLRGYLILWADRAIDPAGPPFANGVFWPISWNHLKGDGLIVNYRNGTAWEYNAWAFRSNLGVPTGAPIGFPGELHFDGLMYDWPFATLLLDFYGTGTTALSGGSQTVTTDTDLTVHAVSADLTQDSCGPVLTKVEATIWNEYETKFSGTRRCICCWDQTMLSDWVRSAAVPNHFKRTALRTDKGKARLEGLGSTECNYYDLCGETATIKRISNECRVRTGGVASPPGFNPFQQSENAALLGLATKFLAFSPSNAQAAAGMNLVGMGEEYAAIYYVPTQFGTLQAPDGRNAVRTLGDRDAGTKGESRDRSIGGR